MGLTTVQRYGALVVTLRTCYGAYKLSYYYYYYYYYLCG